MGRADRAVALYEYETDVAAAYVAESDSGWPTGSGVERATESDADYDADSDSDSDAETDSDSDSDARIERMDHIAVLYGEITAATREFLRVLAESDRHRDWAEEGFGSCAEWLAWRIGVTRNTANEKVRAALALEDLPLISAAMARGEISFSKVRALTRAGTPENEAELLEFARAGSAASLERLIRGWKTLSRGDEGRAERARYARRYLSVFPDEDGMYVVRGRLTPEVGAVLMRAIEAASDALFAESSAEYRAEHGVGHGMQERVGREAGPPADPEAEQTDWAQRRADAVGLIAERGLAAGFGRGRRHGGDDANEAVGDDHEDDRGWHSAKGSATDPALISGSRAERYQVMLHVAASTLSESGEPGRSELDDGTRVTAVTARRLACDAGRVLVHHAADGPVFGAGRRTRTIPPAESCPRGRVPCLQRSSRVEHVEPMNSGDAGWDRLVSRLVVHDWETLPED